MIDMSGKMVCWNDTTNFACRDRKEERAKRLSSKRMGRIRDAAHFKKWQ